MNRAGLHNRNRETPKTPYRSHGTLKTLLKAASCGQGKLIKKKKEKQKLNKNHHASPVKIPNTALE